MKFLNSIKLLMILLVFVNGLISCKNDEGKYYEYFHNINLNKQNKFTFSVTPESNKTYRVMLVLYPKNQQEREKIFNYSHMIYTNRSYSPNKTHAIIKIKNENNMIIYNSTSDIYISAHNSKELDCYLMHNSIKLEKNRNYMIEIEFKNLNQYPLSYIDSKLAFGLGQYYETNSLH